MIKILLYVAGTDIHYYNKALTRLRDMYEGVPVVTVGWLGENSYKIQNNGGVACPKIEFEDIVNIEYDFLIVTGDYKVNYGYISNKLEQMGIPPEKIVLDRTICIHGFSFKKLWALRKSNLTILAMNCWGGFVYHQMGLPFRTPFINMFEVADEWIRFLKSPQQYMNETLKFIRWNQRKGDPAPYPVFSLGDIQIHMNHYHDIEYAEKKWLERKERINWSNILVEAQLNDEKQIREFISLPYYKKACFTSLDISNENSVFYIDMNRWDIRKFIEHNLVDYKKLTAANKIDWTVLRFAEGKVYFYDLFDLLLYGVKTPINNMIFNY